MKMKNLVTKMLVGFFAVTTMFVFGNTANAQGRYSKATVDRIIKNVEERTDRFVEQFDKSLDNSRLDGSRREDELNKKARQLETAVDELRREFDRNDSWAENKNEVRKCLNLAKEINTAMKNRKLGSATEKNWAAVRAELNTLARAYRLPRI
jgi:histidinol dehydrogenase